VPSLRARSRRLPYLSTAETSATSSLSGRCRGGDIIVGTSFTAFAEPEKPVPYPPQERYHFTDARYLLIEARFSSATFFRCVLYSVMVDVVTKAGEKGSSAYSPSDHEDSQKAADPRRSER